MRKFNDFKFRESLVTKYIKDNYDNMASTYLKGGNSALCANNYLSLDHMMGSCAVRVISDIINLNNSSLDTAVKRIASKVFAQIFSDSYRCSRVLIDVPDKASYRNVVAHLEAMGFTRISTWPSAMGQYNVFGYELILIEPFSESKEEDEEEDDNWSDENDDDY